MNESTRLENPDDVEARTVFLRDQYFKKQMKQASGGSETAQAVSSVAYVIGLLAAFMLVFLALKTLPTTMWLPIFGVLFFATAGLHYMHLRLRKTEKRLDSLLNTITHIKNDLEHLEQVKQ